MIVLTKYDDDLLGLGGTVMKWMMTILVALTLVLGACGNNDGPGYLWDGVADPSADSIEDDPYGDWDYTPPPDVTDTSSDSPDPVDCPEKSYIWIANSAEGTLSKLCTLTGEEMGRYITSPQGSGGDPSRTSVNLHGDMVVTNRDPSSGSSSVTKFAAELVDCVDRDGDTIKETSTGGDDVLAWGEDECMIWNTPLGGATAVGCRATAWNGDEDPDLGTGGQVWIGCMMNRTVYVIDGDSGVVLNQGPAGLAPYGGAMDGRGNFWMVAMGCTVGLCNISKMTMSTLATDVVQVPCGYGISVDRQGRVWTAGLGCVNRHDPETGENLTYNNGFTSFNRGIAVDGEGSVWAAVTHGDVLRINEDTVTLHHQITGVGPEAIVGVAIDFQGFVWAVSQGGNAALKINPATYEVESYPIGNGPYTYSDMTGYQLSIVEIPI